MKTKPTLITGRIRVMDRPGNTVDWMLVESGLVQDSGRGPYDDTLAGRAKLVDLSGLTILPALQDTHVHFLGTGLLKLDLDVSAASSLAEVLDTLRASVADFDGTVLRAHSFDPDLLADGRYPTSSELDAISEHVPIFIRRRDGHSSVINSRAVDVFHLDPGLKGVERDGGGSPTGVLRREAHTAAARAVYGLLSEKERVRCYRLAAAEAVERGIGVVHALVGNKDPANRDIELLIETAPGLPIDLVIHPQITDLDRVVALGLPRIGGCLLLDGSLSSRTAALGEPYADGGGRGVLYYDDDALVGFMRSAHARGLQITMHAIGDRAVEQYLRCLVNAIGGEALGARHRLEHCEIPEAGQIGRIASNGVALGMQPTFEYLWGGRGKMYEERLGPDRVMRTNPLKTITEAGILVGGGSDSYVTRMDSLLGIHAAVNHPNEAERLSVFEAVALFTRNASRLSFDEARSGTLEVGKEASFVVLEEDPFGVEPTSIKDIGVRGLYLRGSKI